MARRASFLTVNRQPSTVNRQPSTSSKRHVVATEPSSPVAASWRDSETRCRHLLVAYSSCRPHGLAPRPHEGDAQAEVHPYADEPPLPQLALRRISPGRHGTDARSCVLSSLCKALHLHARKLPCK